MLRDDPEGGTNRGREFYDGQCQSCDGGYEAHADGCEWAAMLAILGGKEEVERQSIRREAHEATEAENRARLERHRRGEALPGMDEMNMLFKAAYGDLIK